MTETGKTSEANNVMDGLQTHLQAHLNGRVRGMRVLVHDHGLVLKGWARNYYTKQLAQHLVMRATSLPIIANEIEVS